MSHIQTRQERAQSLTLEITEQIDNIRDSFQATLENPLISEEVKVKIKEFLAQHRNDDMFEIADLINEDIDRLLRENSDISRSDFE